MKQSKAGTIPDSLNVLLVGGGGREHALAWKLRQSKRLASLWTTHPANPGLASLAKPLDAPFSMKELYRTEQACNKAGINFVIVGPEEPLALGIVDKLASPNRPVFGPVQAGAMLEADKSWAKRLMRSAMIPTAESRTFRDPQGASEYLRTRTVPPVVKAAGLAAGKGVVVAESIQEALDAVDRIMVRREFGDAGAEVVIEERLEGPELSVFALTDSRDFVILDACQDHKRLLEGDRGPNTGGMGAYCPTPFMNAALMVEVQTKIIIPTIDALRREGVEYRGVLYVGLMLTPAGPKVLEYNTRFGDPECQTLLPRIKGDLLELLWHAAAGRLADAPEIEWDQRASCCVVLASPGYPLEPVTGGVITGLDKAAEMPDVHVFHAGTSRGKSGDIVTSGGRALGIVGLGPSLVDARNRALAACDAIEFQGKQFRRDIANKAITQPVAGA